MAEGARRNAPPHAAHCRLHIADFAT